MSLELSYYLACHLNEAPGAEHHQIYRDHVELARFADAELGVSAIDIPEHHGAKTLSVPGALTMATHVAALTTQAKVRTTVVPLPMHDLPVLAGEAMLTDNLTNGRLELGVARGGVAYAFHRFGPDFNRHAEQFREGVQVLERLLTESDVVADGEFYPITSPLTILPRPYQNRQIPLWIGSMSEESITWAAQHRYNVITTAQQAPLELQRKQAQWFHDVVDELPEAERPKLHILARVFVTANAAEAQAAKEEWVARWRARGDTELEVEDVEGTVIYGTPDEVIEGLEFRSQIGYDGVTLDFVFNSPPYAVVLKSLEMFRDEVLPALETAEAVRA